MTTETPKPLPAAFRKDGFDIRLVKRHGMIALLSKTKPGWTRETWEVVRIQSHKGYAIAGNEVPPSEHLPANEQWGTLGWSYLSRQEAERKYASLF